MQDNSYQYAANSSTCNFFNNRDNNNNRSYCNNPYMESSLFISTDNTSYYNGPYYEENTSGHQRGSPYSKILNCGDIFHSTDDILDKLEQSGKVPSKDKFRRMICNVIIISQYHNNITILYP